jgi:hypothetical protein
MPLFRGGVGEAWGLPVISDGQKRYSALAVSERLKEDPAGIPVGSTYLGLAELAELNIGPLGRYAGGEPVRPVRLGSAELFGGAPFPGAAGLFCTGLEFDRDRWLSSGSPPEMFHAHLEFLRTFGISGGIVYGGVSEAAEQLAAYLRFLRENAGDGKILVIMEKDFFEGRLKPFLEEAMPFGSARDGTIPVNWEAGGERVFSTSTKGLGLLFPEELPPDLRAQRAQCDLLIAIEEADKTGERGRFSGLGEIKARLRLGIIATAAAPRGAAVSGAETAELRQSGLFPVSKASKAFLWRAAGESLKMAGFRAQAGSPRPYPPRPFSGSREEAAAFSLLPQWEEDRVQAAGGGLFAVTAKFSRIRAADFREEQLAFYDTGKAAAVPPPGMGELSFDGMDKSRRDFFLYWRGQCRKGKFLRLDADSGDAPETERFYVRLYARECILAMGREGLMEHFLALRDLRRRYGNQVLPLDWLVDFAVIYGIAAEALPLLWEEFFSGKNGAADAGDFSDAVPENRLLLDLALHRYGIEERQPVEAFLPLIRFLLNPKQYRQMEEKESFGEFADSLADLDHRLRHDWNKSFFEFFYPVRLSEFRFDAFKKCPAIGESGYTAYWVSFSNHRALTDILDKLARNPEAVRLSFGLGKTRRTLSLEQELLEELRKESDEVRELLKTQDAGTRPESPRRPALKEPLLLAPAYRAPDSTEIKTFLAGLSGGERAALESLLKDRADAETSPGPAPANDFIIDSINAAFETRFHDLLIETDPGPSISRDYRTILQEAWT